MSTFSISGIIKTTFDVTIAGGPISVPGMRVGDTLISMFDGNSFQGGIVEFVITVDDEIQQPNGYGAPNPTTTFTALFYRG